MGIFESGLVLKQHDFTLSKLQPTLCSKPPQRIVQRAATFVPGMYKIFDEILVNAADNKQRDASMSALRVTIDAAANTLSVWNNGRGVPKDDVQAVKWYRLAADQGNADAQ